MGIDREDVLLVCDPFDGSYDLSGFTWHVTNGVNLSNPLNVTAARHNLPTQTTEVECRNSNDSTVLKVYIKVQGKQTHS